MKKIIIRYLRRRRKRKIMLHRKEMLLKKKSPGKYQIYLQRKRRRQIKKASFVVGFFVLVFSLIFGVNAYRKHRAEVLAQEEAARIAAEKEAAEKAAEVEEKDITVGATGCMLMHGPILNSPYYSTDSGYDYSDIYKYIKPYYSAPDFMTCEFEGSLTGSDYSGYPMFRTPDEFVKAAKDSGVDLQMLASNHIYDGLAEGFKRTFDAYEAMNFPYTGIRKNISDKNYYIADVKGVKIGYINYVYELGYDGAHGVNSIPITNGDFDLINTFDTNNPEPFYQEMKESIKAMKKDGAQFIIANMHWGEEYQLTEAVYQDKIAQQLCNMGVDALIGGHPHCEQPVDVLQTADKKHSMFCIYSVGNAVSNQRRYLISEMPSGHTEDGVMVTLTLHQNKKGKVTLTGVDLLPTWVYFDSDSIGNTYYILPLDDIDKLETVTGLSGVRTDAKESYDRTMAVLGPGLEKAKAVFEKGNQESEETEEKDESASPESEDGEPADEMKEESEKAA